MKKKYKAKLMINYAFFGTGPVRPIAVFGEEIEIEERSGAYGCRYIGYKNGEKQYFHRSEIKIIGSL